MSAVEADRQTDSDDRTGPQQLATYEAIRLVADLSNKPHAARRLLPAERDMHRRREQTAGLEPGRGWRRIQRRLIPDVR